MTRLCVLMGLAAVLCFCSGCEEAVDLTGTWELTDAHGHTGTMTINQVGNVVTGRLAAYGYDVPFTGSVSGDTLTIRIQGGGHDVTLVATASGDEISGTIKDPPEGLDTTFTGVRI